MKAEHRSCESGIDWIREGFIEDMMLDVCL
jgi:hypothetical protein